MILEATSGYDFNEEEVKFLDLLARQAEGNKVINIEDLDELKRKMQEERIPADKLEKLCKKMQYNGLLEYHDVGGENWISLISDQVLKFQAHLKNISCPQCHKLPLKKKTITYCPNCDYRSDDD